MTKLKCTILDDYQSVALTMADWSQLDGLVEIVSIKDHLTNEDELVRTLVASQIIVVMRERTPLKASLLERLPQLKLIVTSGMRNASIDIAAAKAQGIIVSGTASSSDPPVELTWALILAMARKIVAEANALRTGGPWQSTVGADLSGRRLGVLGLGKIGTRVSRIGQAFGMDVIAWSPNLTPERAAQAGVKLASSKSEMLATSDFVTIHLVLSDRTRGLLGFSDLLRMKKSAYLINTSRAQIIEQAALVEALQEGWIAGAAADVFAVEPLPFDDPLRTLPNFLATPHLGYVSQANYHTYFHEAIEDIKAFLAHSPIRQLT